MLFAFKLSSRDKCRSSKKVNNKALAIHMVEWRTLNEIHLKQTFLMSRLKTPTNGKRPKNCAKATTEKGFVKIVNA